MPVRKVNLAAVRKLLDDAGRDLTYDEIALTLGVKPESVMHTLNTAIWECAGVRLVRGRGRHPKVVGIRRHHPEPEWGERPAE